MKKSEIAQNYMKENKIEELIAEMVNSLLHSDKKEDPLVYMIKYIAGQIPEEKRIANGVNITGPFPSKYVRKKEEPHPQITLIEDFTFSGENHSRTVNCMILAFYNKAEVIATSSDDETIKLWGIKDHSLIKTMKDTASGKNDLSANIQNIIAFQYKEEDVIVSCNGDGTIKVWNPMQEPGKEVVLTIFDDIYQNGLQYISSVYLNTQDLIITGGFSNIITFWNLENNEDERKVFFIDNGAESYAFTPFPLEGVRQGFACSNLANDTFKLKLYDITNPTPKLLYQAEESHIDYLDAMTTVVAQGKTMLVTAGGDGKVMVWQANKIKESEVGELKRLMTFGDGGKEEDMKNIKTMFTIDNKMIGRRDVFKDFFVVSGGLNDEVNIWDPNTSEESERLLFTAKLGGESNAVTAMIPIFIDDEISFVTVGSNNKLLKVWKKHIKA